MSAARVWWAAQWDHASTKQRRAMLARYASPGASARILAEMGEARREVSALRPNQGAPFSVEWLARGRHAARVRVLDLRWALRQARAAGKLHEPFARTRCEVLGCAGS